MIVPNTDKIGELVLVLTREEFSRVDIALAPNKQLIALATYKDINKGLESVVVKSDIHKTSDILPLAERIANELLRPKRNTLLYKIQNKIRESV